MESQTDVSGRGSGLTTWEARSFWRTLSGRTKPLVLGCAPTGSADAAEERLVVKAVGLPEITDQGLFNEYLGNHLARQIGINTPEAFIVNISDSMASVLNSLPDIRNMNLQIGAGTGVGCKFIPSLKPVVAANPLRQGQIQAAAHLYAFDLMVQNPDRLPRNTNCAWEGTDLLAYDFEMAFSFLLSIVNQYQPWEVSIISWPNPHLFRAALSGQALDWREFADRVSVLNQERLVEICDPMPSTWRRREQKVFEHIEAILSNLEEFQVELRRSLQ